ncbi:MAG: flagellar basal-body MS-ring/collar protein FliF, partial [Bacteroidales bacterium]
MTKKFSEVLIQSLTDFINGKNLFLFLILFLSVIFIGMLIFWNTQPDFQVLYSNLSQEDAAEISSKLKEKKIPFKFNQSGTTIMVPKEQVYEIRLNLANEGLPKGGGVGFEIFDRTNFGTTDFVQKLNYIRGLQGELSRTIKQIKEVEHARVHIAIPKDTLFVEEQKKPTASVFIRTRTGMALSSSQVEGIVHLISCAVEGLEPGNITVLDNTGKMLSKKQDQSSIGQLTSSQLEYQRNIEEGLKRKVQSMLEEVLGPNKAIARVTANIDFQQVDILEETYDPKPIPRSEQKTLEKSSSNNGSIEKGNTSYEGKASFSAGLISDRQSELRNYEVSKINKRIKNPIGVIKKISAAVIVDGTYAESIDSNGNRIRKYSPRSQEEMKGLENLVKKAIGYEEQRGDQVEIINMPFYSSNMEEDVKQIKDSFVNKYCPIVYKPAVSLILAILLILFI